jgi:hypothetical protein
VTAGTLSGLGCARKFACRSLICWIFCGSGFFAAAGLTVAAGLVCATDGAALADAAAVGVALAAAAAGVVLAVVAAAGVTVAFAAGVALAAAVAGVAVAFAEAGVAVAVVLVAGVAVAVVLVAAGEALGDVFALAAGDFIVSLLSRCCDCCFFASGVTLVAGFCVFVSVVAGGAGFETSGTFFSGFVTDGARVAAGSFTAGASRFGADFNSAGCSFSDRCFLLLGDSSSLGAGV